MICTKPLDSIEQVKDHNKWKRHQTKPHHNSSLNPSQITLRNTYIDMDYWPNKEIFVRELGGGPQVSTCCSKWPIFKFFPIFS